MRFNKATVDERVRVIGAQHALLVGEHVGRESPRPFRFAGSADDVGDELARQERVGMVSP